MIFKGSHTPWVSALEICDSAVFKVFATLPVQTHAHDEKFVPPNIKTSKSPFHFTFITEKLNVYCVYRVRGFLFVEKGGKSEAKNNERQGCCVQNLSPDAKLRAKDRFINNRNPRKMMLRLQRKRGFVCLLFLFLLLFVVNNENNSH